MNQPEHPAKQDSTLIYTEYRAFLANFKTVLLASSSADNQPEASYAPYVAVGHDYYIYVSELATHTRNLLETGRCSLLFIEDEANTNNLFARRRLTFQCTATDIGRDSPAATAILDQFSESFGKFMQLLRTLPDFHLFRLSPQSGNYVAGFGKAYALSGEGLAEINHRDMRAGKPG